MNVRLQKAEDGSWIVMAIRKRLNENPTRIVTGVKRADLKATVKATADEVRPQILPLSP